MLTYVKFLGRCWPCKRGLSQSRKHAGQSAHVQPSWSPWAQHCYYSHFADKKTNIWWIKVLFQLLWLCRKSPQTWDVVKPCMNLWVLLLRSADGAQLHYTRGLESSRILFVHASGTWCWPSAGSRSSPQLYRALSMRLLCDGFFRAWWLGPQEKGSQGGRTCWKPDRLHGLCWEVMQRHLQRTEFTEPAQGLSQAQEEGKETLPLNR